MIPFTGKPIEKLLLKQGKERVMTKVFSLPDVQVGSIIEYEYQLEFNDILLSPPVWYIQQPLYVHKAHYHFVPVQRGLMYTPVLPTGVQVRSGRNGYDLLIEEVPPMIKEDYMPPTESLSYRVLFYYLNYNSGDDFWKEEGKYWSDEVDLFAKPSRKLQAAVQQLIAPGDNEEQKLRKIYAAVMKLENASFTREHSAGENKAEKLKVKTADDIWEQKRGNDDELTLLFIAMVRSAGMKAYAMMVTNRDHSLFIKSYLTWSQLDDEIAIVPVNGKDMFFDPGERYCEFGKLHWIHSLSQGVRQVDGGTEIATTGSLAYTDTQIMRSADLTLESDCKLVGVIRITFTGNAALRWRQHILRTDEEQAKRDLKKNFGIACLQVLL